MTGYQSHKSWGDKPQCGARQHDAQKCDSDIARGGASDIAHLDRGWHYRWPEWIRIEEEAKIKRSRRKKGCSPDNAALSMSFFGRMKQETFYGRDWDGVSLEEFMKAVDDYLVWFRNGRIKTALDNMTPMEYRQSLGFVV